MADILHGGTSTVDDSPAVARRNARVGLVLFLLYGAAYGAFVLLHAFAPLVMRRPAFAGINLAIAYGLFLIVAAFALALVYAWFCRAGAKL